MRPIPFVKGNSTTAENDRSEPTTKSNLATTEHDADLGAQVAGIYASIVSSSTTTNDHRLPIKSNDARSMQTNSSSQTPIYCESCEFLVRDPAHFHGTAHLVSTQSKPSQKRPQPQQMDQTTQPKDTPTPITRLELTHGKDRAIELMKKQGWRYGQGLGKTNQGAPYPMATIWKQDRLGIGHPHTDRRQITHPSISKAKSSNANTNLLKNPRLANGKQLAANAKAEANLRAMMLHYMNH